VKRIEDSALADVDRDAVRECVEPLALALATPPASRMAWRFYAALFLYQDLAPLAAKELRDLIGTSNASTSVALRELEQVGLITRTRPMGSRADVYDLVDEQQYGQNYARTLLRPQPALRAALGALPEGGKAWLRIRSMLDLEYYLAQRVPQILDEWVQERAHLYGR
jgi:hypothetical protein